MKISKMKNRGGGNGQAGVLFGTELDNKRHLLLVRPVLKVMNLDLFISTKFCFADGVKVDQTGLQRGHSYIVNLPAVHSPGK